MVEDYAEWYVRDICRKNPVGDRVDRLALTRAFIEETHHGLRSGRYHGRNSATTRAGEQRVRRRAAKRKAAGGRATSFKKPRYKLDYAPETGGLAVTRTGAARVLSGDGVGSASSRVTLIGEEAHHELRRRSNTKQEQARRRVRGSPESRRRDRENRAGSGRGGQSIEAAGQARLDFLEKTATQLAETVGTYFSNPPPLAPTINKGSIDDKIFDFADRFLKNGDGSGVDMFAVEVVVLVRSAGYDTWEDAKRDFFHSAVMRGVRRLDGDRREATNTLRVALRNAWEEAVKMANHSW